MAKVKLVLNKRYKGKTDTYPLCIKLSHKSNATFIQTGLYLSDRNWSQSEMKIRGIKNSQREGARILRMYSLAQDYILFNEIKIATMSLNQLRASIETEIKSNSLNSKTETDRYRAIAQHKSNTKQKTNLTLNLYGQKVIDRHILAESFNYAQAIQDGIKRVIEFNGRNDILLSEITVSFLKGFEAYCKGKGNKKNTIGAYLRPIRTIFNEAIDEGVINSDISPFPKYKIPTERKTKKRAVDKTIINKISALRVDHDTQLWNAKNYLLFMFNNYGINLIDIAKLKKQQLTRTKYENGKLCEGRLEYVRSKTGRKYNIKLTPQSIEILNEYLIYSKKAEDHIFPIGYQNTHQGAKQYKNARQRINRRFKKLGQMVGISENMTTYVIRHSFATSMKKAGVATNIIGEMLGHDHPETTEIYLESFEEDVLDNANEILFGTQSKNDS